MRFLSILAACLAVCSAANAQLLPISQPLQQRSLPYGVSIPAVTSSSVSYPGCPGEVTSHTNTWYFDQALGQTQSGGGLGTVAHPWKDLQALTGNNAGTPMAGYTQVLLSTAPGGSGGPVLPGDLILVNNGSYGALTLGASTAIVNSPAITIQANTGQIPLFTSIYASEFTGLHLEGLKVQSAGSVNAALVAAVDNSVPHSTSDIILENMDISSGTVATFDGYNLATWEANARAGVSFYSQAGTVPPSAVMNCLSVVNSHIYEVSNTLKFGAIEAESGSLLVQGNEIDHFFPVGVNFYGNNISIGHNYFHDFVQTGQGAAQLYAIFPNVDASLNHANNQSNVYIYNNKHIESVDASQTLGPAPTSFYLNSTGDITNSVVWDNLIAASNECGVCMGNSHNYVVTNNSIMYAGGTQNPEISLAQAHAGAAGFGTGPVGNPPSNGWVFNNIAPIYNNANGNVIQAYHNIAAPGATGFVNWNYFNNWQQALISPTPGSVITLSSLSGQQNLDDGGVGGASPQANEFTTVACSTTAFPCSPQPDWTPKAGSPAKTAGGVQLIPPITDYNGTTFAPPYSIGALN